MALLEVVNLSVIYRIGGRGRAKTIHAVDNVSMEINRGEVLAVTGESGSGKTTLGKAVARLLPPSAHVSGEVILDGDNIYSVPEKVFRKEYRWKRIAYINQYAMSSLAPTLKVRDQLVDILVEKAGYSMIDAVRAVKVALEEAGIQPDVLDKYPFELSGGMSQRILVAMAGLLEPELIVADEPTTNVDFVVRHEIIKALRGLADKGSAILLITHDIATASALADRIAVMYAGEIVEIGSLENVLTNPLHPYTQMLLNALPRLRGPKTRPEPIPGNPPDPRRPPPGCRFHPRCPYATEECRKVKPLYYAAEKGHLVKCHLYSSGL